MKNNSQSGHLHFSTNFYRVMKCEVKLFVAGTVFTEEVIARDYSEARKVALARNPNATVVSVNAKL